MESVKKNKTYIFIGVCIVILLVLIGISSVLNKNPIQQAKPTPKPTVTVNSTSFNSTQQLPTLAPSKGIGLDTQSTQIKSSEKQISTISIALPFRTTVTLDSGESATVGIPSREFQDNQWTLIVYSDIDFMSPPGTPEYDVAKKLFLKSAQTIHDWILSQGADPSKIYIQWGDDSVTQSRAREWLK